MKFRVTAITEGPFRSAQSAKDWSVAITWATHAEQEIMWSWTRKRTGPVVGRVYSLTNRLAQRIMNA